MKRKKIFLVLLMSLVMVFGSSVTALAAVNPTVKASKTSLTTADGEVLEFEDIGLGTNSNYHTYLVDDDAYVHRVVTYYVSGSKEYYQIDYLTSDTVVYLYSTSDYSGIKSILQSGSASTLQVLISRNTDGSSSWTAQFLVGSSLKYIEASNLASARSILAERIVYTSVDIYTTPYADGEIFFQKPPSILVQVTSPKAMTGALKEVMNLIPLGLTCLVGFLALRKALQVLQGILHQA